MRQPELTEYDINRIKIWYETYKYISGTRTNRIDKYLIDKITGKNLLKSKKLKDELFDFFMWFRDSGESNIDLSVEKMIEKYLTETFIKI